MDLKQKQKHVPPHSNDTFWRWWVVII